MQQTFVCTGLHELNVIAKKIIDSLNGKKILALIGEMGAGKTTLIQALCKNLGVTDAVTSPTFAIMNEYKTKESQPVFHFDFYRIESVTEAFDLGYEQFLFSNNYCFIEWAEKISTLLPQNCATVFIRVEDGKRKIILTT